MLSFFKKVLAVNFALLSFVLILSAHSPVLAKISLKKKILKCQDFIQTTWFSNLREQKSYSQYNSNTDTLCELDHGDTELKEGVFNIKSSIRIQTPSIKPDDRLGYNEIIKYANGDVRTPNGLSYSIPHQIELGLRIWNGDTTPAENLKYYYDFLPIKIGDFASSEKFITYSETDIPDVGEISVSYRIKSRVGICSFNTWVVAERTDLVGTYYGPTLYFSSNYASRLADFATDVVNQLRSYEQCQTDEKVHDNWPGYREALIATRPRGSGIVFPTRGVSPARTNTYSLNFSRLTNDVKIILPDGATIAPNENYTLDVPSGTRIIAPSDTIEYFSIQSKGSRVYLNLENNAEIELQEPPSGYRANFKIKSGYVRISVTDPIKLQPATDNGEEIDVKGTDFGLAFDKESKKTVVEIYDGILEVKNNTESRKLSSTYDSDIKRLDIGSDGKMTETIAIPKEDWGDFITKEQADAKEQINDQSTTNLPNKSKSGLNPAVLILVIFIVAGFFYRKKHGLLPYEEKVKKKIIILKQKLFKKDKV